MSSVGIILPVFNAKDTIDRAIDSVLKQTFKDWTLYVIDDCSTDGCFSFIQERFNDKRIKIFHNESNLGVAKTRNVGIDLCNENIMCFLDSDDEWDSNKLKLQVDEIKAGEKIVFSNYLYVINNKEVKKIFANENYLTLDAFLKKKFRVCFSSVCLVKSEYIYFRNIGHEDFYFLFEYLKTYSKAKVIRKELALYYESSNSLSSNKIKAAKWQYFLLKEIFKGNLFYRLYYFSWYAYKAIEFRHYIRKNR